MPAVILLSSEGVSFPIQRDQAAFSRLVRDAVEDLEGDEDVKIPLPNLSTAMLQKVVEWRREGGHQDAWSDVFGGADIQELFKLLDAANYLDAQQLLDLTCDRISAQLENKSEEELRELLQVEDDFTAAEKAQIRKETKWAFHCR